MKKAILLSVLLFALVFAFNGTAFGWGTTSGDGKNYQQVQETAVFFNNSGRHLGHGVAVILDTSGTGVSAGSYTLGSYVTVTNSADSLLAVGVVKIPAADQSPVVVVTKGPIDTYAADSTDVVSSGTAVGTAGTIAESGMIGGGTNLGIALEAGAGTDRDYIVIWVSPTGAD